MGKDGIEHNWWDNFVFPTIRKIKGEVCEYCKSKEYLLLHHTNYENVTINNLVLLCKGCHQKEHARLRREGIKLPGTL